MLRYANAALTDGQAAYVLERLVRERRLAPSEIARYLAEIPEEIRALEARLRLLRGNAPPSTRGPRVQHRSRARRKPRAEDGKALGGTYGGLIRRVPAAEQQRYVDIKNTQGIEAAISALRVRQKP
jgi:hypothetical protein